MMEHTRSKPVAIAAAEGPMLDLREDAKVRVDLKTIGAAIGLVIVACGLYWHQDSRIERLESGLQRVETVNCAVAEKLGLTLPDCGRRP